MSTYLCTRCGKNGLRTDNLHTCTPSIVRPELYPVDPDTDLKQFITPEKATSTQIGGNHYTKLAIQPMAFSMANELDALQHTIVKYVVRFRDKNGIEDLKKARHCIDMLIEHEESR